MLAYDLRDKGTLLNEMKIIFGLQHQKKKKKFKTTGQYSTPWIQTCVVVAATMCEACIY